MQVCNLAGLVVVEPALDVNAVVSRLQAAMVQDEQIFRGGRTRRDHLLERVVQSDRILMSSLMLKYTETFTHHLMRTISYQN